MSPKTPITGADIDFVDVNEPDIPRHTTSRIQPSNFKPLKSPAQSHAEAAAAAAAAFALWPRTPWDCGAVAEAAVAPEEFEARNCTR